MVLVFFCWALCLLAVVCLKGCGVEACGVEACEGRRSMMMMLGLWWLAFGS